jgi:transmembrane sensor
MRASMDSKQIEARAAAWIAQRELGQWNESHDAELAQWLDASMANYIAYIRLEAGWEEARRLNALSHGGQLDAVPPRGAWQPPFIEREARPVSSGQSFVKPLALAASVILVLGLGLVAAASYFRGDRYSTPVGGIASLSIADGSKITLNTDSRIRVSLDSDERRVWLSEGEAFFEIAKDPNRPFIVSAGSRQVRVIGTAFAVRKEGEDLRILVTQGMVQVAGTPLPAGSVARVSPEKIRVENLSLARLEDSLVWRTGYLVFREAALSEVVAEFNRYNTRKLVIGDPEIADVRFSGKLKAASFDSLVLLLRTGFGVEAERRGNQFVLKGQKSSSAG